MGKQIPWEEERMNLSQSTETGIQTSVTREGEKNSKCETEKQWNNCWRGETSWGRRNHGDDNKRWGLGKPRMMSRQNRRRYEHQQMEDRNSTRDWKHDTRQATTGRKHTRQRNSTQAISKGRKRRGGQRGRLGITDHVQKHFHPKTLSSKREDNFIHDTFIQKRVHPMTLSSKNGFVQWHKPFSSTWTLKPWNLNPKHPNT